jgi:hypothetical protein
LPYFSRIGSSTTLGSSYNYIWRVNSFFDPDFSFTGHQPNYYDFWSQLYTYYQVESFDLQCEITNLNLFPIYATLVPYGASALPVSNPDAVSELAEAKTITIDPIGSQSVKKLSIRMNLAKFVGQFLSGTGNSTVDVMY